MTCAEAERHLPNLLAGDLDPQDHAALQSHLEACPTCREAVTSLAELAAQLDRLPLEQPSADFRDRFYRMLAGATANPEPQSNPAPRQGPRLGWGFFGQAAAILLLVGGGFLGGYLARGGGPPSQPGPKGNLALLHQNSQGLRMAGILLASQGDPRDPAPAGALLDLLDQDPNEAVRLAAVDALYLYGQQPQVRERLAAALPRQTSPRVQLALVDLLGGLREQRALEALKRLLGAPGTSPEVARRVQTQLDQRAL